MADSAPGVSVPAETHEERRQQRETVRRNAQTHFVRNIFSFVYWYQFTSMLSIESIVVMSLQWRAKCDRPLVGFLLGYTINSCISLVLHVYFYRQLKDGVAFPFEPRWKRFLGNLKDASDVADRLLLLSGFVMVTSCRTCQKTAPWVFGITLQIVVFKVVSWLSPIVLVLMIFFCLSFMVGIVGRYERWRNKNKYLELLKKMQVYPYQSKDPGKTYAGIQIPAGSADCAICLQGYVEGVDLRILPCKHHYHAECIDQWVCLTPSCPLCKRPAFPSEDTGAGVEAQV